MKTNIIHTLVVCLTICLLLFVEACSNQDDSQPEGGGNASLYLNITTIGQTRAGLETLSDNEKMHSVRVVVLHSNGTVEHNRFYSLDGPEKEKKLLLKVTPDETKKIFLFANEESVTHVEGVSTAESGTTESLSLTAFFKSYSQDAPGFAEAVNDLYFAPDYSDRKPIPMSSMYEIEVPKQGAVQKTFYVVRVATKFTINFMNWRSETVTVNSLSIANHADKNFLMAHVKDTEQNKKLFNGETWIEWLKEVSGASSESDSYEETEAAGWLKDYELPADADNKKTYTYPTTITVNPANVDIKYPTNSEPGKAQTPPIFYLPESMNLKAGATDGEQEYTLTIHIAEGENQKTFNCPLRNLKALFRNTHVVVNITLKNSMEIVVDVIPYSEVFLDPIFGLNIKE